MASYNVLNRNKYGRQTIYIDQTEEELLSLNNNKLKKVLDKYIPSIMRIHEENATRIRELWDIYLGFQEILNKEKHTRKEINNKIVENWAYAIVDFKKAWQLGNPIQYVMANSTSSNEVNELNNYFRYENKEVKDQWIYEDMLVTGRGFRFQNYKKSGFSEDEAPFEIHNIDRDCAEVIYSNGIGKKQLFSIVISQMQETVLIDENYEKYYYQQLTIYFRNKVLECKYKNGTCEWERKVKPISLNEHPIVEYYLNRDRISLIEIGEDLFNGINKLESNDFDDLEQFVNAIMVFTNAAVDESDLSKIKELGAVSIKSTENKKASVDLLQNRLNATDTQVMYTRLLIALHQILGVPMATDNGSITSGDTGKAKMTGQGYTSAGIRAKTDETIFKMFDTNSLKITLKICKQIDKSKIKTLNPSEVDNKLNRDMSDNLLTKAQGLMNLLSANVPKEYAVPIINLFSDPNAVVKKMEETENENIKKEQENIDNSNEINEQNNTLKRVNEMENQNQ